MKLFGEYLVEKKIVTASQLVAALIKQNAMLPSYEDIKSILPASFVLYQPKDVVSGDFYWMAKTLLNKY